MIGKKTFHRNESHKNGFLFQIQLMVSSPEGDVLRSRFAHASFDRNGERLAVVDQRHAVYVMDLSQNKFWRLKILTSCTLLTFCQATDELMIGYSSGNLALINCETGEESTQLKGHKVAPEMFSFSSDGLLCVTSAPTEGIIWDMKTKTPAHCLMLQPETALTQVLFMPVSNDILASFQDNVIHIWQLGSFECIKQVDPDAWNGCQIRSIAFTRNGRAMVLGGESLQLVVFMMDDLSSQKVIELPSAFGGIAKLEFIAHLFDRGANKMLAVLGINGDMCFLDLESAQLVSKFVFHGVDNFVCSPSGKYLACITSSADVKVFSVAQVLNNRKNNSKAELVTNKQEDSFVSEDSKGAARIIPFFGRKPSNSKLSDRIGELKRSVSSEAEDLDTIINGRRPTEEQRQKESVAIQNEREIKGLTLGRNVCPPDIVDQICKEPRPNIKKRLKKQTVFLKSRHSAKDHLEYVNAKIGETLNLNKVQRIVKEEGELPELYRCVIWRTVLRLPNNIGVYRSLIQRGIHPAWMSLSEEYNLSKKSLLKTLQSVLSCLTHWCPAIAELTYMPLFVFPFVRVFQSNAFVCFEVVMTIIVNWCQHWFEFLSFPPLNVLAMIENALSEYDSKVLNILYDAGITTKLYAWPLLHTAFSEVLSPNEWLRLWDHVLCNPPWFLILAVVSYNSCCRVALKSCSSEADFEFFYHRQNPIDMDLLIKKTYKLCDTLTANNHPRQYIRPFEPLPQGSYPVLSGFPMYIIDYKNQQRNAMRRKEEDLLREEHELLQLQLKIDEKYRTKQLQAVHETRLRDIEEATKKAIENKEQRLREKRKELLDLNAEIRNHEHQLISKAQAQMEDELYRQRCAQIVGLQEKLESKTREVDFEQEALNNEQRTQYARLAALRRELKIRLDKVCSSEGNRALDTPDQGLEELVQQNERLTEKLRQIQEINNREQYASNRTIAGQLSEMDRKTQEKDLKSAQEALRIQDYLLSSQKVIEGMDVDARSKDLREEVNNMLEELLVAYLQRTGITGHSSERNETNSTQPRSTSSQSSAYGISSMENLGYGTSGSASVNYRSHHPEKKCRLQNKDYSLETLPSVRTKKFYRGEKAAIDSAMRVRADLLSQRR